MNEQLKAENKMKNRINHLLFQREKSEARINKLEMV